MTAVTFTLPFPAKALWPNGRAHWAEKARAVKSARRTAWVTATAVGAPLYVNLALREGEGRVSLAVTVHPKTRNAIDRDNCVAALKSYIDGIADALGVDDRNFDTPSIAFGEPIKGGLLSITLTVTPHSGASR